MNENGFVIGALIGVSATYYGYPWLGLAIVWGIGLLIDEVKRCG